MTTTPHADTTPLDEPHRMPVVAGGALLAVAVVLTAVNLRPAVTSVAGSR